MKTLVLFRTLALVFRGLTALKVTATFRIHRPVRVKEVLVLRVLFLVVLPTIKGIPSLLLVIFQVVKVWNQKNCEEVDKCDCLQRFLTNRTYSSVCSLHIPG
jgi:hypothetical protein